MSPLNRFTRLLIPSLLILGLTACASTKQWSASGGDRQDGVVRLSYEYPEFHQPTVSDVQAEQLAENRCHTWGYTHAEPIGGQIRQCSTTTDGNCVLWKVTREYQCGDASMAQTSPAGSASAAPLTGTR
jgi:hypothetical protein